MLGVFIHSDFTSSFLHVLQQTHLPKFLFYVRILENIFYGFPHFVGKRESFFYLSVVFAVSLISGALGLTAILVTQADLIEAYAIAAALGFIVLYTLWRLEIRASYLIRTGQSPSLKNEAASVDT